MTASLCIVGFGQLGSIFSKALVDLGHHVRPVSRGESVSSGCDGPVDLILVTVGEDDLDSVLSEIPEEKRDRVALVQNELRPDQWLKWGREQRPLDPTVAIVWFEKKAEKSPHVVLSSVLYGRGSDLLSSAYQKLDLPCRRVRSQSELAHELVLKNLYILGLNLAGLKVGGIAEELLAKHNEFFFTLTDELIQLEQAFLQRASELPGGAPFLLNLDHARLQKELRSALFADPSHRCAGRSAPRRLERTRAHAASLGLSLLTLESLHP